VEPPREVPFEFGLFLFLPILKNLAVHTKKYAQLFFLCYKKKSLQVKSKFVLVATVLIFKFVKPATSP